MKIFVYKTIDSSTLYQYQEQLQSAVQSVLSGAYLMVSTSGTIHLLDTAKSGRQNLSGEEQGYRFLIKLLKDINEAVSKDDLLVEKGINLLFPKELKVKSASKVISKEEPAFNYTFAVKLKPSSRERSVVVYNAELRVLLSVSGVIRDLYLMWRPISQRKEIERLPLHVAKSFKRKYGKQRSFPNIRYHFDSNREFILPMYKMSTNRTTDLLPATRYFA